MMNIKTIIGALLISLASSQACAGFVKTHWQADGDGKATLHEETGLEWMNINQTDGWSIAEVQAELGEGGRFEGWRLPNMQEVNTMLSTMITNWTLDPNESYYNRRSTSTGTSREYSGMRTFRSLFSYTYRYYKSGNDWGLGTWGLHLNDEIGSNNVEKKVVMSGSYRRNYWNGSYNQIHSNWSYSDDLAYKSSSFGVYLVSDGGVTLSSINNPALNLNNPQSPFNVSTTLWGLSVGMLLVGFSARRRAKS